MRLLILLLCFTIGIAKWYPGHIREKIKAFATGEAEHIRDDVKAFGSGKWDPAHIRDQVQNYAARGMDSKDVQDHVKAIAAGKAEHIRDDVKSFATGNFDPTHILDDIKEDVQDHVKAFIDFAKKFRQHRYKTAQEFAKRMQIFKENMERFAKMNEEHLRHHFRPPQFGITPFADLTPAEFKEKYLRLKPSTPILGQKRPKPSKGHIIRLPARVDWRRGNVTEVMNQKECGGCWAFAIAETMESMESIQHGTLPRLSVQQLIDCTPGMLGCDGGDIAYTADWLIQKQVPVTLARKYPLTLRSDQCASMPKNGIFLKSREPRTYYVNSEEDLLGLVVKGPVAIAVDSDVWQFYTGGVLQSSCPDQINHAVQIVGYDLTAEVPYYIVRNSWGRDWGDGGYLYLQIGANMCGLATEVVSLQVQ